MSRTVTSKTRHRVMMNHFIVEVAERSGIEQPVVELVLTSAIAQLTDTMNAGCELVINNFGRFYAQRHNGHRVNFKGEQGVIEPYMVARFSATRGYNRSLTVRDEVANADAEKNLEIFCQ